MAEIFLVQLVGMALAVAGFVALTVSARLFGTPLTPAEKRRASDEWNRRQDVYRLPINLETIASAIFFLAGIVILVWSKFNLCSFLSHWLPSLPWAVRVLMSCR
jgi:hypothetical protein